MATFRAALCLVLFGSSLAAGAQAQVEARRLPGPIKDAGTYHVATGTWDRSRVTVNISPDAIYRNDAPSGYFGTGWEGCWTLDEIAIPGATNPKQGSLESYDVDGFQFSYCTLGQGTVDWYFGLWSSYVPCDDPTDPAGCIAESPGELILPGAPAGSACWTVTIDLSGGYEICIQSDGGTCVPDYQGGGLNLDHAGIGFGWITSTGFAAGPLLAGDPSWLGAGDGTCYQPAFNNACGATAATGLGHQDLFSVSNFDFGGYGLFDSCAVSNGCAFFGGYKDGGGCGSPVKVPLAQFAFTMFADCAESGSCVICFGPNCSPITIYCDEATNPNNVADISIDTFDSGFPSINVSMLGAPPNQFAYLLVGNGDSEVNNPPGSKGSLCVVGGNCLGRYDKDIGQIDSTGFFNTDIKNSLSVPCAGTVNISPGAIWNFQYWHRQPMGQPSTFSNAVAVQFF